MKSNFTNNYAVKGGVAFAHYSSKLTFTSCYFNKNFGTLGGVAYVNNDGIAEFNDCFFVDNSAL